jgi:hypothetical protein
MSGRSGGCHHVGATRQRTAATRCCRTRDPAVTPDGQRAAADTVHRDALSTGLPALTPARVLLIGIYIHILLSREKSLFEEPARGRRACGRWREAGELSRRGRPMPLGRAGHGPSHRPQAALDLPVRLVAASSRRYVVKALDGVTARRTSARRRQATLQGPRTRFAISTTTPGALRRPGLPRVGAALSAVTGVASAPVGRSR